MTLLPLLAVGILMKLVAFLFVVVSILLILVVLIQKGRGGGLSGAFGGGMASGLLGSKTGDFLTWITIGMVAVFLGLAVVMARFYRPDVSGYGPEQVAPASQSAPTTSEQSAPAAPATTEQQPAPTSEAPAAQPAQPDATGAGAQPPAQGTGAGGQ